MPYRDCPHSSVLYTGVHEWCYIAHEEDDLNPRKRNPSRRSTNKQLDKAIRRAEKLANAGRLDEAIELLEPFCDSSPHDPRIYVALGIILTQRGDMWRAMKAFEQATSLTDDPELCIPLGMTYLENELYGLALHSFRRSLVELRLESAVETEIRRVVSDLEEDVEILAGHLHLSQHEVERGLFHLAEGNRALRDGDYHRCVAANEEAVRFLGTWPPPLNNLSVGLFFEGAPDAAISTSRQVLAHDAENVQALSNLIRFLYWSGRDVDAREVWKRLKVLPTLDADDVNKKAEAAEVLGDDEAVYDLLHWKEESLDETLSLNEELSLAVAEANLGRREARWRLERLSEFSPVAEMYLTAVKEGRPGPGWASRFPYFTSFDMLPPEKMLELIELAEQESDVPDEAFYGAKRRFLKGFPQLIMVAEKLIWEEDLIESGVEILFFLSTPAAFAALRRFGLSQAGDDDARLDVLARLVEAGEIEPDSKLRVWLRGEWREIQVSSDDNQAGSAQQVSDQVSQLLQQAKAAFDVDDLNRTEELLWEILQLDSTIAVAWSNLGLVHIVRQEVDQAKEMWRKALEVDPMAVPTRCHLATVHVQEGDVEGAETWIEPLNKLVRWEPKELAQYQVARARIMLMKRDYEGAEDALNMALEADPDHEPAVDLLGWLRVSILVQGSFASLQEGMEKRQRSARRLLQNKLTLSDPTLAEVLPLYTRDMLDGMSRIIVPQGSRRSGLRKAELVELNRNTLVSRDTLERLVAGLSEVESSAMRDVLKLGGAMPWAEFDRVYGNDEAESPYWNARSPQTTMGRLRARALLAEVTVGGELLLVVPLELRDMLVEILL
jgi:tetratricopeptide (TPR) repeat protein